MYRRVLREEGYLVFSSPTSLHLYPHLKINTGPNPSSKPPSSVYTPTFPLKISEREEEPQTSVESREEEGAEDRGQRRDGLSKGEQGAIAVHPYQRCPTKDTICRVPPRPWLVIGVNTTIGAAVVHISLPSKDTSTTPLSGIFSSNQRSYWSKAHVLSPPCITGYPSDQNPVAVSGIWRRSFHRSIDDYLSHQTFKQFCGRLAPPPATMKRLVDSSQL